MRGIPGLPEYPYVITKWATIAVAGVSNIWLQIPHLVQVLLMLMGLDIISGILAAAKSMSLNSSVMLTGIYKKCAVFPLLALFHIIEGPLNLGFSFESVVAVAFIVYEAMSIVENAANAGAPVPTVLIEALAKAKVRTATPEEIRQEFATDNRPVVETRVTVKRDQKIIQTPPNQPDLLIDKTVTVVEEQSVKPLSTPPPISPALSSTVIDIAPQPRPDNYTKGQEY